MNLLTAEDIAALTAQDSATLARWWCALNSWEWPAELPNEESLDEYTRHMLKFGGAGVLHTRRSMIMKWIELVVSARDLSREWNKDSMTDEEFDDFWRGCHEGDVEAHARYWARVHKKIAERAARQDRWPDTLIDTDEWPDEIDA